MQPIMMNPDGVGMVFQGADFLGHQTTQAEADTQAAHKCG